MLQTHEFLLLVVGEAELTDAIMETFLVADCTNASLWSELGHVYAAFARAAPTLDAAHASALADTARMGYTTELTEWPFSSHPSRSHNFTLRVLGIDVLDDEIEGAFVNAGCDDATLFWSDGQLLAQFDRTAPTPNVALASAIADVRAMGYSAEVSEWPAGVDQPTVEVS